MRILTFLLVLCCFYSGVSAQSNFFNSKNAYLGQSPPNDTPRVFAKQMLVPDSGIAMGRSAFSADGKEFYYGNSMHWFNAKGNKIRYFKYERNGWQGPFVLNYDYSTPTFSVDGRSMYFAGKGDGKHSYVWISHRNKAGWTDPVVFLKKDYGLYNFMPTNSGTFYAGSNANAGSVKDYSTYDFCKLTIFKTDIVIKSLGPVINTPAFDGDFYVAPDESYMIISYKEKPDYECELGITFRKPDHHSWTAPLNLGPLINDGDAHRWGEYVTPDGKYLIYTKGTGEKDCCLYWVRFDTLKAKLKKEALGR